MSTGTYRTYSWGFPSCMASGTVASIELIDWAFPPFIKFLQQVTGVSTSFNRARLDERVFTLLGNH